MNIIVNLNHWRKIDTIFKKAVVYVGLLYDGKQKSVALLVKKTEEFDGVTTSKLINAIILKRINISKNCHGRFIAN